MPDRNRVLPFADIELHRLVAAGDTFDVALQFGGFRALSVAGIHIAVRARSAADRCGTDPVVIAVGDLDVPTRWEFRTSGLWAEQVCVRPDIHWSFGLEAFALQIDKPDELLRRGYGLRIPLGWELDFEIETVDPRPTPGDEDVDGRRPGLVEQAGTVEGLILIGPDEFPIAGPAHRIHAWGDRGFVTDAVSDRSSIGGPGTDGDVGRVVLLPTPIGVWTVDFGTDTR